MSKEHTVQSALELSQNLVKAARAIEQVIRDYDLSDKDPRIDLSIGRTAFPPYDSVHEGHILNVSVQHPSDEKSRFSFSIFLDDQFQRTRDDMLSVEEAAVLGMET